MKKDKFGTRYGAPLHTTIADRCSDALLERIKDMACERCVIRLACMSRVVPPEFYWCKKCQGWWLVEESLLIRCDGHVLNELDEPFTFDRQQMPNKKLERLVGALWNKRQSHGIEDCPNCTPDERIVFKPTSVIVIARKRANDDGQTIAFPEPPSVRVIDGYNFMEEP